VAPYTSHFGPEDFDRYKAALREATFGNGPFDANDTLAALLERVGLPLNAGDAATLLGDLTDLGELRRVPSHPHPDGGVGPHRFVWTDEPAATGTGERRGGAGGLARRRVVIEPAPMELGLNQEAYDALVADLEREGFQAEIRRPIEERGVPPQEAVNAAIWLKDHVGEETLGAVIKIFIERMLRSRRRRANPPPRPPVVIFYGPDGKPLREIEIPERADD
jgi:hypothetical protein